MARKRRYEDRGRLLQPARSSMATAPLQHALCRVRSPASADHWRRRARQRRKGSTTMRRCIGSDPETGMQCPANGGSRKSLAALPVRYRVSEERREFQNWMREVNIALEGMCGMCSGRHSGLSLCRLAWSWPGSPTRPPRKPWSGPVNLGWPSESRKEDKNHARSAR